MSALGGLRRKIARCTSVLRFGRASFAYVDDVPRGQSDKRRLEAQCLKRWVKPEDIARFCVFLASGDCLGMHRAALHAGRRLGLTVYLGLNAFFVP